MDSEQRLIEAINDCRIYQTRILLDLGAKVEFLDEHGYTPLLRACQIQDHRQRTRTILIKELIQRGADVNTKDPEGHHSLAYACITSKEDVVNLLIESSLHNIELNQRDNNGDTPLFHAIRNGNLNILKILISCMNKFHIDMHGRNHEDRTPYIEAVRLGRNECAKVLLEQGNASCKVQVNPFLEDHCSKRTTRKACKEYVHLKRTKAAPQHVYNHLNHRRVSSAEVGTTSRRLVSQQCKNAIKTNSVKNSVKNGKNDDMESLERVKLPLRLNEVDIIENVTVVVDPITITEIDSCLATNQNTRLNAKPLIQPRPQTAYLSSRELNRRQNNQLEKSYVTSGVFLTDDTIPVSHFKPRHRRIKTAPPKNRHAVTSIARDQDNGLTIRNVSTDESWHSQFPLPKPPSLNSLNILMTLYGEQFSPESSYRKSVKPRTADESSTPAIVVADNEHDKRSDGRRSSSGSVRSTSGAARTKFSALLNRTLASSMTNKKLAMKSRV